MNLAFSVIAMEWFDKISEFTYEPLLCNTPLSPRSQSTEMEGYLE